MAYLRDVVKLATWNVNSLRARLDLLADWLGRRQPDLVCLQETKVVDELFPVLELGDLGYNAVFSGEKSYNGVAILTRAPVSDFQVHFPLPGNQERRLISVLYEGMRVYCAYVPNGRDPLSEHFPMKLAWIDALGDLIFGAAGAAIRPSEPVAVLGDFNVAPDPRDVYRVEAMEGRIHFTLDERAALQRLLDRGLVDAFRAARPEPGIFSWWDYRQGMFRRNLGLRIDHVWTTAELAGRVVDAGVDKEERARERASDHAPVVVELAL